MHRINLRGPWTLSESSGRVIAKRKFHRPASGKHFVVCIQHAIGFPIEWCSLNDTTLLHLSLLNSSESDLENVFRADVTGILTDFNVVTITWSIEPEKIAEIFAKLNCKVTADGEKSTEQAAREIRYTPSPIHPLHVDSWLEIQE